MVAFKIMFYSFTQIFSNPGDLRSQGYVFQSCQESAILEGKCERKVLRGTITMMYVGKPSWYCSNTLNVFTNPCVSLYQ